jgi:hypothetical protein
MTDFAPAPSAPASAPAPAPAAPAAPSGAPAAAPSSAPAGGAPAAPAKGVGNSIASITAPPSISDAVKAAREQLSRGEHLVASSAAPPITTQPRNADGTFAPVAGAAADPNAPAPSTDPAAPAADPNAPAPTNGDADPNAGDAIDPELVVALPGRRPEDGDVELVAADKETAERLRQLKNGFFRGEDARQLQSQAQAAIQEVQDFALALDVDPIGVIEQRGYAPEQRANLVLSLLTQPDVYAMVAEILPRLADEKEFRYIAAEVGKDRYEQREKATERVNTERAITQNVQLVASAIEAIVPDNLSDAQRAIFVRDARSDISRHANARGVRTIDPMHVPQILSDRLTAYGMDINAAYARLASAAPGASTARPVSGGARPAPALRGPSAAPAAPAPAGRTAEEIRTASDKRRSVAAIAPAGAGAPALSLHKPPAGSTLKEAMAHARSQSGGRPR